LLVEGFGVGRPALKMVQDEEEDKYRHDDADGPQHDHRRESRARPLAAGLEPAEVILMWIWESVDSHKTSKKSPVTRFSRNRPGV
jgi:hypothetical protein